MMRILLLNFLNESSSVFQHALKQNSLCTKEQTTNLDNFGVFECIL